MPETEPIPCAHFILYCLLPFVTHHRRFGMEQLHVFLHRCIFPISLSRHKTNYLPVIAFGRGFHDYVLRYRGIQQVFSRRPVPDTLCVELFHGGSRGCPQRHLLVSIHDWEKFIVHCPIFSNIYDSEQILSPLFRFRPVGLVVRAVQRRAGYRPMPADRKVIG